MAGIDLSKKRKIGLVCSGGAVKAAAFHMGVALALEALGFRFQGGLHDENQEDTAALDPSRTIQVYVGSSAGCLIPAYLAQGGVLKDLVSNFQRDPESRGIPGMRYWEMVFPRVRSPWELLGLENFLGGMIKNRTLQSPFGTEGISRYLKQNLIKSDRFSDLEADFFVVATELNHPRKVVFGKYKNAPEQPFLEYRNDVSISDACSASMSLPPIYHPMGIQVDGQKRDYYDGEIREPLSSHVARDAGCDLIICSYTHQPVKMVNGSLAQRGVGQITLQAIYQAIEQKIQSARGTRSRERELVGAIRSFFKEKELDPKLCDELVADVEARLSFQENVDYIYIHPERTDVEMFLMPHFSLNRQSTEAIVKRGYRAAMSRLKGLKVNA